MPRAKYGNRMNPKKSGKWKHNGAFHIPELPQALVMDILSRLPFKTLCSCRCVCKDWLHITSDLHFAQLHLQRSPISILIKTQPPVGAQSKVQLIHVEKSDGPRRVRIDRMRFAPQKSIPCSLSGLDLINTCNGFICLSDKGQDYYGHRDGSLYVCNPILGQYISIPSPDDQNRCYYHCFTALGFSAKAKEYKVVQTSMRKSFSECHKLKAKIYTIGSGGWRSLGKFPRGFVQEIPFNSFLHGALHWVQSTAKCDFDAYCPQLIQSFDFEREEFRPLQPPVDLKEFNYYPALSLGVLKGCIFLCVFDATGTSDLWIMKDYGVQESWTKTLVIDKLWAYHPNNYTFAYEPIMFFNDVEILMTCKRRLVVYYNQETKDLKKTPIIQTKSMFQAFGYYPCFVSLHDVSNGEEVKRIRDHSEIDFLLGGGSGDDSFSGVPPDQKSGKLN